MEDWEIELNRPRFKNISSFPFPLKRGRTIIEVIAPGQIVVGEQYLEFVDDHNMGPLRWLNKPTTDERKIVIDTRGEK